MDLSIVIPAFNEESNMAPLVEELDGVVSQLQESGRTCEVLIIDDGSRDATFAKAKELAQQRPYLRVLRLRRNFGQTAAMSAGFDHAAGDVILPWTPTDKTTPQTSPNC